MIIGKDAIIIDIDTARAILAELDKDKSKNSDLIIIKSDLRSSIRAIDDSYRCCCQEED